MTHNWFPMYNTCSSKSITGYYMIRLLDTNDFLKHRNPSGTPSGFSRSIWWCWYGTPLQVDSNDQPWCGVGYLYSIMPGTRTHGWSMPTSRSSTTSRHIINGLPHFIYTGQHSPHDRDTKCCVRVWNWSLVCNGNVWKVESEAALLLLLFFPPYLATII